MQRKMKQLIIITLFTFIISFGFSQDLTNPKKIRSKGIYTHKYTNLEFPQNSGKLKRESIFEFNKKKSNIGVTYTQGTIKLTLYIYPAGGAIDGRLRNEYRKSLQEIVMVEDHSMNFIQEPKIFELNGYKLVGLSAFSQDKRTTRLTVYECGEWFYKIRISGTRHDSLLIDNIEKQIMDNWNPIALVKHSNLETKAYITVAPIILRDSLMLGTIMGSAIKKLEWAFNNTDSLERAAGFPDMYLNMHVTSFKELVEFKKRKVYWEATPETYNFLEDVENIISHNFVEEFILEEYGYLMLVSDDVHLDIEEYKQWLLENNISIGLDETKYYLILFDTK